MIRILIFMGLLAVSMLLSSCGGCRMIPLTETFRQTMDLMKKEVQLTIKRTDNKVKRNELEAAIGNEVIDSLTTITKQIDLEKSSFISVEQSGNRERILSHAERLSIMIQRILTNLKSLHDLYDISTRSQFETTSYFPASNGNISPAKMEDAKKAIELTAQRIIRFIDDHSRQQLEAVIVCSGVSVQEQQNVELNELQSRTFANLLLEQIRSKEELILHPERIHYTIRYVNVLPIPDSKKQLSIKDKSADMITISWSLLPASLYTGKGIVD
jgi:hypothetical protein